MLRLSFSETPLLKNPWSHLFKDLKNIYNYTLLYLYTTIKQLGVVCMFSPNKSGISEVYKSTIQLD